jgi:hypothetical protein
MSRFMAEEKGVAAVVEIRHQVAGLLHRQWRGAGQVEQIPESRSPETRSPRRLSAARAPDPVLVSDYLAQWSKQRNAA